MTSITQQKADMRETIHSIVMDRYDNTDLEERKAIVWGLLARLMQHMSLPQLQAWHYAIQQEVKDGS